jgi:hypothetical protein
MAYALDGRESEHYRHVGEALQALDTAVNGLRGTDTDHGEILASLDGISDAVAVVADQVASLLPPNPGPGYRPIPAVQWWAIGEEERDEALTRLRDWVGRIYRPHYGHLAITLAECWEDHPLCLVQLDWLSELWAVLYLQPTRSAGTSPRKRSSVPGSCPPSPSSWPPRPPAARTGACRLARTAWQVPGEPPRRPRGSGPPVRGRRLACLPRSARREAASH